MPLDVPGTNEQNPVYTAFGLRIRSCLPMPELLPASGPGEDITIVYGPVPVDLPEAVQKGVRFQAAPGRLLLKVDGVARYLVSDGRGVAIERDPAGDDDDVRLFLLGSVLGALLHQRADLVLHGSAIVAGDGSVAFLGISGAGKSTLAMAFKKRGYSVLTDDLCVVRPAPDGRMMIQPGFPQAKLWLDSLERLAIAPDDLKRIRRKLEKRALPIGDAFVGEARTVRRLYILHSTNRDELKLTPLEGPQKFAALKEYTYRFRFVDGLRAKPAHFQQALAVAQQAAISNVVRPREPFRLDELVALLEADFSA
jgi:hypothetical protein